MFSMGSVQINLKKAAFMAGEELAGSAHFILHHPISNATAGFNLLGKEIAVVDNISAADSTADLLDSLLEGFGHQPKYRPARDTGHKKEENEFLRQELPIVFPVDEKGRFKQGEYDIPFKFTLPKDLPASYKGYRTKIWYTLTARIAIPLRPDLREELLVKINPATTQTTKPHATKIVSEGWQDPDSPGLLFTLEKISFRRGEDIEGKCFFRNPTTLKIRKIDVRLEIVEQVRAKGYSTSTVIAKEATSIPIREGVDKGEENFHLQIPEDSPPPKRTVEDYQRLTGASGPPWTWQ